jgi:multiple sugar transport system substrate-binding protein
MSRRFVLVMIGALLVFGACSPAALPVAVPPVQPTAMPAAPAVTGKVSFMISADPDERAAFDQLVAVFKQKYPGVAVDVVNVPGEVPFRERLIADISSGSPADVILFDYEQLAQFYAKGAFEPLTPYLAQSQLVHATDFYPQALAPFTWQGAVMCLPLNISSDAVYYNKTLFDAAKLAYPQAGWRWDDFVKDAQALTDAGQGQYGTAMSAELGSLAPFIWQNGGELVDNTAQPTRLALDTPEATGALEWAFSLSLTHRVIPSETEERSQDSQSRFLAGKTAMYIASRKFVVTARATAQFDWDVAPLPQAGKAASVLHSDGYCMASQSKNKPAAWAFMEYANSVEGQTLLASTGRTVPSLKAVAESQAYLAPGTKPEHARVWLDQIPSLHALPVIAGWGEVEERASEELERALYGDAPLNDAIREAIDRTTDAIRESAAP